jgi:hypothetical protein
MPVPEDRPASSETIQKTDWLEFWVRFVCGALLGILIAFALILNLFPLIEDPFEHPANPVVGTVGVMLVCGFAAVRYGDRFWCSILRHLRHWWFWW